MLKVQPTGQRGPATTASGRNGLGLDKNYVVNISVTTTDRAIVTIGNHRLPVSCHNHQSRLITGKDRTLLFIFTAYLELPSAGGEHIVSPMGDTST